MKSRARWLLLFLSSPTEVPMRLIGLAVILTVCLTLAPLAGEAQAAGKVPRVGVLANGSAATSPPVDAFRQGLRDLGYVEGQNLALEIRWAEGRFERLPNSRRNSSGGSPMSS